MTIIMDHSYCAVKQLKSPQHVQRIHSVIRCLCYVMLYSILCPGISRGGGEEAKTFEFQKSIKYVV